VTIFKLPASFAHRKRGLKADTRQSGLAVGITLLAGALFLSAPGDSVSDHKFQFVLIIVNVCNLISTVYGIYMISYVSVS
jgi:hypothetical protein